MKKYFAWFFICTFVMLCCAGCINKSWPIPNSEEKSTLKQEAKAVSLCRTATSDGIYLLANIFPDSVNILYIDFATRQQIFLCNRVECKHNQESCTSYLPIGEEQSVPLLSISQNGILLTRTAAGKDTLPSISIMDFDGANKHELLTLNSNEMISGKLFEDENFCYFERYTIDKEKLAQTQSLVRANWKTGEMETLYTYAENEASHLMLDAYNNSIVLDTLFTDGEKEGRGFSFLDIDKIGTTTPAISAPFYFYTFENESAFFENGFIYSLHYADKTIHCINSETNEKSILDCGSIDFANASETYLFSGFDKWLRLKVLSDNEQGGTNTRQYLINIETNEIIESTLQDGYLKKPLSIEADYGDFLCVISDFSSMEYISSFNGESQVQTAWQEVYSLIKKEDYLNNIPNYQTIANIET